MSSVFQYISLPTMVQANARAYTALLDARGHHDLAACVRDALRAPRSTLTMTLEHVRTRLATSDQLRHLAAVIAYQIDTSDDDAHLLPYPNWQWGLTPLGLAFELVYMGWTAGPDNAVSNQWGPAVLSQEWQQPSRSGVTFTLAFAHSARVLWQADAVCEADIPAIVTQVLPVMRDLAALEVLHALAVAPVAH